MAGIMLLAQVQLLDQTLSESKNVLQRISEEVFNAESILTFFIALGLALIIGRIVATILRFVTKVIADKADKTEDLTTVNQLRQLETLIVLSIAVIRTLLVIFALYFWWTLTHEEQQSNAILGAGAVLTILLSGALFNILRDIASGSAMMAEHWFGVGDHISIEPFVGQGVVERVTLRSTKIRRVTGEILWVNNKDIAAVSVTPKGVRTIALELFVKNIDKGIQLIEDANIRLPIGASAVSSPLAIMTQAAVGKNLWHITAIGEVAPGREWLLDKFAIDVLKEIDEQHKVLAHEPISRYADSEAERRFARTIHNASKSRTQRGSLIAKVAIKRAVANVERQRRQGRTIKPNNEKTD